MNATRRICLWAGPRYGATPLMYAFGQRPDTTILDEPLYGHYLYRSGAVHPGREEVLTSREVDPEEAIYTHMLGRSQQPVLFIKSMAHHLIGLDVNFLSQFTNLILIRHPRQVLSSLVAYLPEPRMLDTAYEMLYRLYSYLEREEQPALVIQLEDLMETPEIVLQQICQRARIPYYPSMLRWQPGSQKGEGVWGRYWYGSAQQSGGFQRYSDKSSPLPERLEPLLEECMEPYEKLRHICWQQQDEFQGQL